MLKPFLLGLAILSFSFSKAQFGYFSAGYLVSRVNTDGVNNVVKAYNQKRDWLREPMGEFGNLHGASLGFGGVGNGIWMDFSLNFSKQRRTASGLMYGEEMSFRDMELKNNSGSICFGISNTAKGKQKKLMAGGGLRMEMGSLRISTRTYTSSKERGNLQQIAYDLSFRFGPQAFLMVSPTKHWLLSLSSFYGVSVFPMNYTQMDETLNVSEYNCKDQPQFNSKNSNFGFVVSSGFTFH